MDFFHLWKLLVHKLNQEELEKVAAIMRNIWLRRNKFVLEDKFSSPNRTIRATLKILEEFQRAQKDLISNHSAIGTSRSVEKWKRPGEEMVKVNWDTSFDSSNLKMGAGIVLRDGESEVLVALCMSKMNVNHLILAEFHALWRAVELCIELNMKNIVFEGDALVVIKAVNSKKEVWVWYGQPIED
ncbi:hypothetical protein F2P56_003868 [Juglans regia]|uniref:Uncharacterized protein LOC108994177 n=2 Tax=Juglans regia TaxID=51240 RepID=A0A2I4EZL8_JUGRE|nr:uncharacterized protein LOC108994177 [Juglans regia]KAF5477203.1 hypothetical protein F2P56_003868 [Juglans regia]